MCFIVCSGIQFVDFQNYYVSFRCSVIIQQLYTLQSDYHKSSYHPSPYSWPPSPISPTTKPPSLLLTSDLFSISISLLLLCLVCFTDSTYEWDHTVFVFLCLTYVTWHDMFKVYPCCHKWQYFTLFYDLVVSNVYDIYIYVYIYIYLTSSLSIHSSMNIWNIPFLGYCKWCHNEYKGVNLYNLYRMTSSLL